MSKLVDFYNVKPQDMESGIVFAVIVTCHISHIDHDNKIIYVKCYRCKYPQDQVTLHFSKVIPQGQGMSREDSISIAKSLFPVITYLEYEVKVL